MAKAIFTTKVNPAYDDLPEQRYHFPRRYLNAARRALNDWIVWPLRAPAIQRAPVEFRGTTGVLRDRVR